MKHLLMQTKRAGVLPLKKRKSFFRMLGALTLSVLLASCASLPRAEVDLLSLLPADEALYLHVPVRSYEDVVTSLLLQAVPGLSEKDGVRIVKRTDDLYLSAGSRNGVSLASSGSYPKAAIKAALSEKNGWKAKTIHGSVAEYTLYNSISSPFSLSFPELGVACISENVEPMVRTYDALLGGAHASSDGFSESLYAYLAENVSGKEEIRFACPNPQSFTKLLFGSKQNIGLTAISGSISRSKNEQNCALSLLLEVSDPRTIKATAALVKLAIFPVAAQVRIAGERTIEITEYTMSWKKLYLLFGI